MSHFDIDARDRVCDAYRNEQCHQLRGCGVVYLPYLLACALQCRYLNNITLMQSKACTCSLHTGFGSNRLLAVLRSDLDCSGQLPVLALVSQLRRSLHGIRHCQPQPQPLGASGVRSHSGTHWVIGQIKQYILTCVLLIQLSPTRSPCENDYST
jgi:hypothetical protein